MFFFSLHRFLSFDQLKVAHTLQSECYYGIIITKEVMFHLVGFLFDDDDKNHSDQLFDLIGEFV